MRDLNISGVIRYVGESVSNCFFSALDGVAKIIDDCVRPFFRSFSRTDRTAHSEAMMPTEQKTETPAPPKPQVTLSSLSSLIPQGGQLIAPTPSRTPEQKNTPTNPVLPNLDVVPDTFSSDDENADSEEENKDTRSAFGFIPTINWGSRLWNDADKIFLEKAKREILDALLANSTFHLILRPDEMEPFSEQITEGISKISFRAMKDFKENGGTAQDVVNFINESSSCSFDNFEFILSEVVKQKKGLLLSDF